MRPIQYYIGILLVLEYAYCLPLAGQVKDKVAREGGGRLEYTEVKTERSTDGKMLTVSFKIADSLNRLGAQEMLYIYPSLVSSDGNAKVDFPLLCISGKKRYRAVVRKKTLGNNPYTLVPVKDIRRTGDLKGGVIPVRETLPFERWMASGHLSFREEVYGCAECGKGVSQLNIPVTGIDLFGPEDYKYIFYTPEKVEIKCYEEEFDCKVTFKSAQHELLLGFGKNQEELARLDDFVSKGLRIKGARLREVHIMGYASPEGEFSYNKHLAERRTHTLSYYVLSKYPQLKKASIYEIEGVGEDWKGLENIINVSSLAYKDEILSAIKRHHTDVAREAAIRSLDGGKVYAELLSTVYPTLRRTVFRMKFDVRPYTDDELEEIFINVPGCLSQYEMCRLAQQYAEQGKNPVNIYKKAYEQFAPDPLAALNYANALLKYEKDADKALMILDTVKSDSRSVYPMAIAHNMKGDWRKAEELLKKDMESRE